MKIELGIILLWLLLTVASFPQRFGGREFDQGRGDDRRDDRYRPEHHPEYQQPYYYNNNQQYNQQYNPYNSYRPGWITSTPPTIFTTTNLGVNFGAGQIDVRVQPQG